MKELRWRIAEIEKRKYNASRLEASFHQIELPPLEDFADENSVSEISEKQELAMKEALEQAQKRKQTELMNNGNRK
jgi:hypothetical protein